MYLKLSTYRNFLVITIMLLLIVPCSLKKELKQFLNIETNQQHNIENSRTICVNYTQHQVTNQKQNRKLKQPIGFTIDFQYCLFVNKIELPDFYNTQKEKVPSYILFEQFLI